MAANLREQYEAVQQGAKTNEQGAGKLKQQRPKKQPVAKGAREEKIPQGQTRGHRDLRGKGAPEEHYVDALIPGRPFQPQKQWRVSRMASQGRTR